MAFNTCTNNYNSGCPANQILELSSLRSHTSKSHEKEDELRILTSSSYPIFSYNFTINLFLSRTHCCFNNFLYGALSTPRHPTISSGAIIRTSLGLTFSESVIYHSRNHMPGMK
ncbi:hypothetical protein H0G86_001642 [Trichoderma simmonsii]|uniref:Uncharacterized protein n=1 Tax=Trichoderma simmonsii TaxID=1491479 RepID=A0A8G0L211_9HYPO|nr:hypothetical protein H0G86_001642 [Trichoderma simmonsii]